MRYDDIKLFIKNYGEQNQEIFVKLKSGLEQCTALKVIEGDSVELEFEEPVNKSIRYYFNRRPDGRICKAENYTSDLLGYRKHIDDYFYNKTGGTLVRTEQKIDSKTLYDDAIKLDEVERLVEDIDQQLTLEFVLVLASGEGGTAHGI